MSDSSDQTAQENLGNLSTGGSLDLGQVLEGRLFSEPGVKSLINPTPILDLNHLPFSSLSLALPRHSFTGKIT